ncbi:DUF5994 family protein [Saccharothrix sp. BKS2]|uniref:DUF5994 family protein n=1 Tax=Saccharothrix sp. BKS2 TaxID=3064400 RepID=UPI0039EC1BCE
MTSEPHHRDTTASVTRGVDLSRTALRLRLKPVAPHRGHVDGAWWPTSRELPAELPGLIEAVADRLGSVDRVVYASTFWGSAPNRLELGGRVVALEGLAALDTDTVHITGGDQRRIDLLVIPPEAFGAAADRAMAGASSPDNDHLPAAILATAGVRATSRNR